jgi:hypothetical protein
MKEQIPWIKLDIFQAKPGLPDLAVNWWVDKLLWLAGAAFRLGAQPNGIG